MRKRAIALALAVFAFLFFCCGPMAASANAVAIVDDAFIAIVIATLAACGIVLVTSGEFENSVEYVRSLITDYAGSQNTSVGTLVGGLDYGRNKQGNILLNNRFLVFISGFIAYLKLRLGLVNNQTQVVQQTGYYFGTLEAVKLPIQFVRYGDQTITIITVDSALPCYAVNCDGKFVALSEYPLTIKCEQYHSRWGLEDSQTYTLNKNDGYIAYNGSNQGYVSNPQLYWFPITSGSFTIFSVTSGYIPQSYSLDVTANAIMSYDSVTDQPYMGIKTGTILAPDENPDYTEGDGAILDVGGYWGETLPELTDETIPDAFSEGAEGAATLEFEGEGTVEEEVEESQSEVVSDNVSDYVVSGLEEVFPFCIPFDLYAFVSALDAPPEAPCFEWRFYVPGICDETIEIDLAVFDTAAALLRTMELLLFCVGLAFVTRKIIRG